MSCDLLQHKSCCMYLCSAQKIMLHRPDDTPETSLRVAALQISIKADMKNIIPDAVYEDADYDLQIFSGLCDTVMLQQKTPDPALQDIVYNCADILLRHYPDEEKITWGDIASLYKMNGRMTELMLRYRDKFDVNAQII